MRPEPLRGDGVFAPAAFERDDDAPDDRFYALARKVVHIDDGAIAALGRLYAEVLPAGGALLDLMSSWRSHLPFGDEAFDGAMCAVSIQYVIHPVRLLREVRRVLRPGAPFVVSFSNRCFPTKAVAVWLDTTDQQHVRLVRGYFEAAGGFTDVTDEDRSPGRGDPLYAVW